VLTRLHSPSWRLRTRLRRRFTDLNLPRPRAGGAPPAGRFVEPLDEILVGDPSPPRFAAAGAKRAEPARSLLLDDPFLPWPPRSSPPPRQPRTGRNVELSSTGRPDPTGRPGVA
jgi:hypothetical protein